MLLYSFLPPSNYTQLSIEIMIFIARSCPQLINEDHYEAGLTYLQVFRAFLSNPVERFLLVANSTLSVVIKGYCVSTTQAWRLRLRYKKGALETHLTFSFLCVHRPQGLYLWRSTSRVKGMTLIQSKHKSNASKTLSNGGNTCKL